ncbi:hypothetical protein [Lentzea jiangxiensis]|uniref:Outer membrane channel protein CpnT-like N-terminal domain-containing protein n=1 Tax=Lentzea jiangxiensis TaxID=641025 RepID=A0A1H0SLI5_9PSEU|nr:hypothetical protein [Lentzea jiangxiensis]SDP42006.1 hypothetical protein SAMN05421507_108112 [Lentzea jiangxiensis]
MAITYTIDIPKELEGPAIIFLGTSVPTGDEKMIWDLHVALEEISVELDGETGHLVDSLRDVMDSADPTVGRAFWRYGEQLAEQPAVYAQSARELSEMARQYALAVQAAKISFIVQLVFAVTEILRMWFDPFEWPLIGPFIGLMRQVMQVIFARFSAWVARALQVGVTSASGFFGKSLNQVAVAGVTKSIADVFTEMVDEALEEGLEEVAQSSIVQVWQAVESQKSWDWEDTLKSFAYGAAGGAFAGLLGGSLKEFKREWAGHWASNGAIEGLTEVFVGVITIPEGGDPGEIWKGALNGVVMGAGLTALGNWKNERDERREKALEEFNDERANASLDALKGGADTPIAPPPYRTETDDAPPPYSPDQQGGSAGGGVGGSGTVGGNAGVGNSGGGNAGVGGAAVGDAGGGVGGRSGNAVAGGGDSGAGRVGSGNSGGGNAGVGGAGVAGDAGDGAAADAGTPGNGFVGGNAEIRDTGGRDVNPGADVPPAQTSGNEPSGAVNAPPRSGDVLSESGSTPPAPRTSLSGSDGAGSLDSATANNSSSPDVTRQDRTPGATDGGVSATSAASSAASPAAAPVASPAAAAVIPPAAAATAGPSPATANTPAAPASSSTASSAVAATSSTGPATSSQPAPVAQAAGGAVPEEDGKGALAAPASTETAPPVFTDPAAPLGSADAPVVRTEVSQPAGLVEQPASAVQADSAVDATLTRSTAAVGSGLEDRSDVDEPRGPAAGPGVGSEVPGSARNDGARSEVPDRAAFESSRRKIDGGQSNETGELVVGDDAEAARFRPAPPVEREVVVPEHDQFPEGLRLEASAPLLQPPVVVPEADGTSQVHTDAAAAQVTGLDGDQEGLDGPHDQNPVTVLETPTIIVTDADGNESSPESEPEQNPVDLPPHVRESRALGLVKATHGKKNGVEVAGLITTALGGQAVKGLTAVETMVNTDSEFESFLGDGREFQVKVGKRWYAATVVARFEFDGTKNPKAEKGVSAGHEVDFSGLDPKSVSAGSTVASGGDIGATVAFNSFLGPVGSLGARVPLGAPAVSQSHSTSVQTFRGLFPGQTAQQVEVPVRWSVSVVDDRSIPAGHGTVTGSVTLSVPRKESSPPKDTDPEPKKFREGVRHLTTTLSEAVSRVDGGFAKIAAMLHPSTVMIGAPGRTALERFVSAVNIRAELPNMLETWVSSPDVQSPHGKRGSGVRMKAAITQAELLDDFDDTTLALHDASTRGVTNTPTSKRGFGASGGVGGAAGTDFLGGAVLVGGSVSVSNSEATPAGTQGKHEIGTDVKGRSGAYAVKALVTVQAEGGEVDFEVDAVIRLSLPEALERGFPVPADYTGPEIKKDGERFLPPYLAQQRATGNAKVDRLDELDEVKQQIANTLARIKGFDDFLPEWGTRSQRRPWYQVDLAETKAKIAEVLSGVRGFGDVETARRRAVEENHRVGDDYARFAEMMANQRMLDTNLSPGAVKSQLDSLVGKSLPITLKRRGFFSNDYVRVTVKAKLTDTEYDGEITDRVVRSSDTRESKMTASSNREFSYSAGVDGRLNVPTAPGTSKLTVVPNASFRYNSSTTRQNASGPATVNFLVNAGSSTSHRFSGDIEYDVTIETYSRPRAWMRRVWPGSPGRDTPVVKTIATTVPGQENRDRAAGDPLALEQVKGKVRLYLPDSSVLTGDPAAFAPGEPRVRRVEEPKSITELLLGSGSGTPVGKTPDSEKSHSEKSHSEKSDSETPKQVVVTEWLHVEAFTGAEHLEEAALRALVEAAGDDDVLTLPGSSSRRAVDQMFSPEHIKANLNHAVNTGLTENALRYGRRLEDRAGALGTRMVLSNPKLVSISDNTAMEHSSVGGTKARAATSKSKGWDFNLGTVLVAAADSGENRPTIGRGGAALSTKFWSRRRTTTTAKEMTGLNERKRNLPGTSRTVLIQVDANVDIVAESRLSHLLYSRDQGREGVNVVLPGAVYLRVGEDQARRLGLLGEVVDPPWTEQGTLAPPSTMREGEPSSLGLGVFEQLPDLTPMVSRLRDELGRDGEDLIPDAVLDDAMNNLQRMLELTDRETVRALMDSALDGGVPLVAHRPKFIGRDSYQVVLRATPGKARFKDVVNDGVKMNNILVYFGRDAETKARARSWGASLRALFGVAPHAADPALGGSTTGSAATEVGQSRSVSHTTAMTALDVHVLETNGPTARYSVPVTWELEIHRPDGGTRQVTMAEDLTVRVLADDLSSRAEPVPVREPLRDPVVKSLQEIQDELISWKQEGVRLPKTVHPQTVVGAGELRAGVLLALNAAGLSTDATAPAKGLTNAALSMFGAENVRLGVVDASHDGIVMPDLHETALLSGKRATLQVHSRLVNPRLTGLSDDVTMTNQRSAIPGTGSEFQAGDSVAATIAVNGEVGTGNDRSEPIRDPGARFGDFDGKATYGESESFGSEGGSARQEGTNDSGLTGLVTYDVEYRIVVTVDDRTVVLPVRQNGAAQIRVAQVDLKAALEAPEVPTAVITAQREVKERSEAWRETEREVEKAQRAYDDLIGQTAAELAAAEAMVRGAHQDVRDAGDRLARERGTLAQLDEKMRELHAEEAGISRDFTRLTADLADLPSGSTDTGTQERIDALGLQLEKTRRERGELALRKEALVRREAVLAFTAELADEAASALADLMKARDDAQEAVAKARANANSARGRWWTAKLALEREIEAYSHIGDVRPAPPAPPAPPVVPAPSTTSGVPRVGAPPRLVPPTPQSHQGKDVSGNESWRHDPARTAEWSEPSDPVDRDGWADRRDDVNVRTVSLDVVDVRTDSALSKLTGYDGLIRYDLRRVETSPGKFVQEYTLKVHLDPADENSKAAVPQVMANAARGVDNLLNRGFRLPSGDQFHVNLEFVGGRAGAHAGVVLDTGTTNPDQKRWGTRMSPEVLAHEVLHYLGVPDEYKDSSRVFQRFESNSGVHENDGGLMGTDVHLPDPGIRPRHLWLIERIATGQVAVPDTRIEPAGTAAVPPPAHWTPEPDVDGTTSPPESSAEPDTRPAPQPGTPHMPGGWEDDADTAAADQGLQTHLSDLDNASLVESVLRSAKFQGVPIANAAPLVGTSGVKSTVDAIVNDVELRPHNHDLAELTAEGLSSWVASKVDLDMLSTYFPTLLPATPGLTGEAAEQHGRAALAQELAKASSKHWAVVNAGLDGSGMARGDLEVIDHLTRSVTGRGALPTPAHLLAQGLRTPSWADSHVGKHLFESIARALGVRLVVNDNGTRTYHGRAGAPQVQIVSRDGTFGALGGPTPQEVRTGMEAWLASQSLTELGQTIDDLFSGRPDNDLHAAADKIQLIKRAAAHPDGPQGFVRDLMEQSSNLNRQIAEKKSPSFSLFHAFETQNRRTQEDAQRKEELADLVARRDRIDGQVKTLAAESRGLAMTHVIDTYLVGPNADRFWKVERRDRLRIEEHLAQQIAAAEKAGFDTADLKALQARVLIEPAVRGALAEFARHGLDAMIAQAERAGQALQDLRDGKEDHTGFNGFMNRWFGSGEDFSSYDFEAKIAYAEALVKQAELRLSFVTDPEYSNRFYKIAGMELSLGRAQQAGRDTREPGAEATGPQVTPRRELDAFKALLLEKSSAELDELAARHHDDPTRLHEINRVSWNQEIARTENGLRQHLGNLEAEMKALRDQIGDLKQIADALPDAGKTGLIPIDEGRRQAERQSLELHEAELTKMVQRLQYDRNDALTAYALTLPPDQEAPAWQRLTFQDVMDVKGHVVHLISHARITGQRTPELDRLFDRIWDFQVLDLAGAHRSETPPDDEDGHARDHVGSGKTEHDRTRFPAVAESRSQPRPFMQDPSALAVDVDVIVPGGFAPVEEGTSLRSFEASLYGLDTAALRELQRIPAYANVPDRAAAIQRAIEISLNAAPPQRYDQATRMAGEGLAKAEAVRTQWNAADVVPGALKTQMMLDEQAARRERADRDVQWHRDRLDRFTNNRDASLTSYALRLPADPHSYGWRQFGEADLAVVQDHVEQQIRDAEAGDHPTKHLTDFRDFVRQLRRDRSSARPEARPAPPMPNPVVQAQPADRSDASQDQVMEIAVQAGLTAVLTGTAGGMPATLQAALDSVGSALRESGTAHARRVADALVTAVDLASLYNIPGALLGRGLDPRVEGRALHDVLDLIAADVVAHDSSVAARTAARIASAIELLDTQGSVDQHLSALPADAVGQSEWKRVIGDLQLQWADDEVSARRALDQNPVVPTTAAASVPRSSGYEVEALGTASYRPRRSGPGPVSWPAEHLVNIADEVARADNDDPQLCVTQLVQVRDALYPGGVSAGIPVDDSVLGSGGVRGRAAPGAVWTKVADLEAIEVELRKEGRGVGSSALVLWNRPGGIGHAVVGHHTEDRGVLWIEPQRGKGDRIVSAGDLPGGVVIQAVLLDSRGRFVPDGFTSVPESQSAVGPLLDPPASGYGAIGVERELKYILKIPRGLTADAFTGRTILVVYEDGQELLRVVTEAGSLLEIPNGPVYESWEHVEAAGVDPAAVRRVNVLIPEIVTSPIAAVPGDVGRAGAEAVTRAMREVEARFSMAGLWPAQVSDLETVFPRGTRFRLTSDADKMWVSGVAPPATRKSYNQFTVGVPINGLFSYLRKSADDIHFLPAQSLLKEGIKFGERMGIRFLEWSARRSAHPGEMVLAFGNAHADAVRGYLALVYTHVAASFASAYYANTENEVLLKNYIGVAVRQDFDVIREALPNQVQRFLADNVEEIFRVFVEGVRGGSMRKFDHVVFGYDFRGGALDLMMEVDVRRKTNSVSYLQTALMPTSVMRANGFLIASQRNGAGMNENAGRFRFLDTNANQLANPLLLLESRHAVKQHMSAAEADAYAQKLNVWANEAYSDADRMQGRSGNIMRELSEVMKHPITGPIAAVLSSVYVGGLVELSPHMVDQISLGLFALVRSRKLADGLVPSLELLRDEMARKLHVLPHPSRNVLGAELQKIESIFTQFNLGRQLANEVNKILGRQGFRMGGVLLEEHVVEVSYAEVMLIWSSLGFPMSPSLREVAMRIVQTSGSSGYGRRG